MSERIICTVCLRPGVGWFWMDGYGENPPPMSDKHYFVLCEDCWGALSISDGPRPELAARQDMALITTGTTTSDS